VSDASWRATQDTWKKFHHAGTLLSVASSESVLLRVVDDPMTEMLLKRLPLFPSNKSHLIGTLRFQADGPWILNSFQRPETVHYELIKI